MTPWTLILWLASGQPAAMPSDYTTEAACRIAAAHAERQAQVLHAIDPDRYATVAWTECRPAAEWIAEGRAPR